MTWKHFFTSSIGKKFIMGLTGFFLISFLVVHCTINAMIFVNDGGQTFNHWGHFMGTNIFIRIAEVGLMVFLLLHIVQGLTLWQQNRAARPVKYAVVRPDGKSKWYSKSMGLLGTLILIFLIMHFYHFWIPSRFGGMASVHELQETSLGAYAGQPVHDLFAEMVAVFTSSIVVVILYVLGCISLCWHLLHGFQSAFQTFGINHKRYTPAIKAIGAGYSVIICAAFAAMPVAIYAGLIR